MEKKITIKEERLLNALTGTHYDLRLSRESAAAIVGNDREAREVIHDLRLKGYAICSDSRIGGYYLAMNEAEIVPFISDIESRIKELYAVKKAVKKGVLA